MSYTGTQVYFPASSSFETIRDALAERFPEATLAADERDIRLAFDDIKRIRVSHDTSDVVPEEALWHGEKAEPAVRDALSHATHRFVIEPDDPAADFDDMYNELLFVFEAMRDMPDAVGHDPFDGALYHDPSKASGTSSAPTAKVRSPETSKAKAKTRTKAKPTAQAKVKPKAKSKAKPMAKAKTKTKAKPKSKSKSKSKAKSHRR